MKSQKCAIRFGVALLATLLIGLAAAFTALPAFAEPGSETASANASSLVAGAVDGGATEQAVEPVSIEEINPIYAEELADADLFGNEAVSTEQKATEALSLRSADEAADEKAAKTSAEDVFTTQEEAIAAIRTKLLDYAEEISVTLKTDSNYAEYGFPMFYAALADSDEVGSPEDEALVDYVRYSYLAAKCSCKGTHLGSVYTITYTYSITYSCSPEQTRQLLDRVQQLVESFGFGDSASDVQKIKTIYDCICAHVIYDYEHLNYDNHLLKYSAYAALENGAAVCQGYSQLFSVMCGYAGVSSRIISGLGNGSAHAWNIVGVEQGDGSRLYYDVDSTWDSSNYQDVEPYEYFMCSEAEFPKHARGNWGSLIEYGSSEFGALYPMADDSCEATVVTIEGIEYALFGNEATASSYTPIDSTDAELVVPKSVVYGGETYTVTAVGENFLKSKSSVNAFKKVELPSTITTIGSWAFLKASISKIALPDGLLRIGTQAFAFCTGFTEVSLPSSLELVGEGAFEGCGDLKTVKVLGPTAIGIRAFTNLASGSDVWVSTPCQQRLLANNGETYITPGKTGAHLAEPETSDPGHRLRHIDECLAACEASGCIEYWECRVCGQLFTDSAGEAVCELENTKIDALGHDLVHHEAKDATCAEVGWDAYDDCSRCDYTTYKEIPVLEHTPVVDAAVAPTCTKAGLTEGSHCSACNEVLVAQEAVPALGHNYASIVTAPTCTAEGYTTYTCSRCSYSYTDSKVSALGHSWDAGKVTTAPTYTAKGVKTFTCTRCNRCRTEAVAALPKLVQTIVPAKKVYTVRLAKVKKRAQKIVIKFKAAGGGKVTYKAAKTSGGKVRIAKNGKVTVSKGTKKGIYTLKVKVTAAAIGKYAKTTKTVNLKIRVK